MAELSGVYREAFSEALARITREPRRPFRNPLAPREQELSPRTLSSRFLLAEGAAAQAPTPHAATDDERSAWLQNVYTGAAAEARRGNLAAVEIHLDLVTRTALSVSSELRLVIGDISGLQAFIHGSGSRRAARSLRARSFYLQLLSLVIARVVAERCGMPPSSVVSFAGGNFQLIIPATAVEALLRAKTEIEGSLSLTHGGALAVALGWSEPATSLSDYPGLRAQAVSRVSLSKNRPHEDADARNVFRPGERVGIGAACRACGRPAMPAVDDDTPVCAFCRSLEELGAELRDAQFLALSSDPVGEIPAWGEAIARLGVFPSLVRHGAEAPPRSVTFALSDAALAASLTSYFLPIGRDVPRTEQGIPVDFEALVSESGPRGLLAVAKLDVDDLGQVMQSQSKDFAHLLGFSKCLSLFFEGRVNELARDYRIYMIFSGGDDILCAGSLPNIIDFLVSVHADFRRWTAGNPTLHVSCGISVGSPSRPIARAMMEAEDLLTDHAKKRPGKNSVHLMGATLSWEELGEVIALRDRLVAAVSGNGAETAGRNLLQRLQLLQDLHDPAAPDEVHYGPLLWQSHYALQRFAEQHGVKWVMELVDDLQLARGGALRIALAARLAELKTAPHADIERSN